MKIVQVIPCFTLGGAETMCENLIYALSKNGHCVSVISLYPEHTPITKRLESNGFQITYLDKKLGLDISMISKIAKVLKKEKPDVVHTHLDCIKYAVPAARIAGVKNCVHTVHNMADKEAAGLAMRINRVFYKSGWSVPVALSNAIQKTIAEYYTLEKASIPIIYNGIDISKCAPKPGYALHDPITITHIGRFSEQKNHIGLIDAFFQLHERYPNTMLQLVGDGDLRPNIEKYVGEKNLSDRVSFLGHRDNVYDILHDTDIFVLPSLYEGFPMTIIEAMASGVPVIASEVGGVPDMIEHNQNGKLVPCDPNLVCQACAELIEDEQLRQRLGQQGLKKSQEFSSDEMAKNYIALYERNSRSV